MEWSWMVDNLARGRWTRAECAAKLGITIGQVNAARTWLNTFVRPDSSLRLID